jgi:hypothetical protein
MGNSTSAPIEGPNSRSSASGSNATSGASSRGSRFARLPSTGRYATYKTENGATVHLLGVIPASSLSAEEANDLVSAMQPKWLYVDEHPEIVGELKEDVVAGKVGAGFKPDENPRSFKMVPGAGVFGSILVRTRLVDNEMFALLGAELYAPYKAGILAAIRRGSSGKSDAAATSAAASSPPAQPAEVISFPFSVTYNNYEMVGRPSHWEAKVVGDNMMQSVAVRGSVYNQTLELTGAPPLVAIEAAIPPDKGYFTRRELTELQTRNQAKVNDVALRATAASPQIDVEGRIMEQENTYIQAGDAQSQTVLYQAGVASQSQAQAIAHTLQSAAKKLGPGEHGVALVNIGGMASLQRNWTEARAPEEVFPPMNRALVAAGYIFPTTGTACALWGIYRGFKRFPKSTVCGTILVGGLGALMANGIVFSENTLYGPFIRWVPVFNKENAAQTFSCSHLIIIHFSSFLIDCFCRPILAKPRVTSPTAGMRPAGPGGAR